MRRYLQLFGIQVKAAVLLSLQYRVDFFVQAAMALFWVATALAPLLVLFSFRSGVAGWTAHIFEQARSGRLLRPQSEYVGPVLEAARPAR